MDFTREMAPPACSRDIPLPSPLVERLAAGRESMARYLETSLRPYNVQITLEPSGLRAVGDALAVNLAATIVEKIVEMAQAANAIHHNLVAEATSAALENALKFELAYRLKGINQAVRPLSLSQVAFMNALLYSERSLLFGVGPTGTGKTHLAIAAGLSLVAEGRFKSLVITRPRVLLEGETMTPALRAETAYDEQLTPIDDELRHLVSPHEVQRLTEQGLLEITPLGRMRGRTFNDSYIIVDEAQNMTVGKMRMAVTRMGRNSRMVLTGDPAQVDLVGDQVSGLTHLLQLIAGTDLAWVHRFETDQIIRNPVVAQLEALYSGAAHGQVRAAP